MRPGRSARPRPTGSPQWEQNRLPSATCGSLITADDGSRYAIRGTSTRPAPSIPRRPDDRDEPVRVLPVRAVPLVPLVPVVPDEADAWSGGEPHSSQ
ncbi:hypothetical protein GCM10009727_31540 [Actinomadura napierensis]|uniref:Uncharacterized protein n=1 Tax=Actinomadura napierensis TaxID=267854 RepID=A0ABP5KS94_9ACTN